MPGALVILYEYKAISYFSSLDLVLTAPNVRHSECSPCLQLCFSCPYATTEALNLDWHTLKTTITIAGFCRTQSYPIHFEVLDPSPPFNPEKSVDLKQLHLSPSLFMRNSRVPATLVPGLLTPWVIIRAHIIACNNLHRTLSMSIAQHLIGLWIKITGRTFVGKH